MSGSQYYHRSTRPHRDDTSLPSIRDVVGDELEGRVRPNPYTFGDVRGALPALRYTQTSRDNDHGPTLPPIRHSSHSGREHRETRASTPVATHHHHHRHHSSTTDAPRGRGGSGGGGGGGAGGAGDSGYIYGVLRPSPTAAGDLIHAAPPASKPHGILRQSTTVLPQDQNPDRRHRCDYCGKGFDRPSSLEVHLRTHTGSQPFVCEWPGCNRTFSVRSNMLRHWRSHQSGGGSSSQHYDSSRGRGGDDDEHYYSDSHDASAHHHYHSPDSRYYNSRRR